MKARMLNIGTFFSAALASACCIGPLILIGLGIGGLGFAAALAEYRPYFMAVTFIFLGTGFYFAYRKPKEICADGSCAAPNRQRINKTFLWIASVFALTLMAFPYYSGAVFGGEKEGYEAAVGDSTFMLFAVEGMTCSGCEAAINIAASQNDEVMKSEANYEEGTLLVKWKNYPPSKSSIQRIISDLEDIGYQAELAKKLDTPAAESSEDE